MTKFIDATSSCDGKEKEKKKTVFKSFFLPSLRTSSKVCKPETYDFVKLIRKKTNFYNMDIMVAFNEGSEGEYEIWYLGDWGDGC